MPYRSIFGVGTPVLSIASIAAVRCVAPEWSNVGMGVAALATAAVFAILLATLDPRVADKAMVNAREAQSRVNGFLGYRGFSTGVVPLTSTTDSLRDAVSSSVALAVCLVLGVIFHMTNTADLLLSCSDLSAKALGALFGELVSWAFVGQGIAIAFWDLIKGRKK